MTTNEIYNQVRIENAGIVLCKEESKCVKGDIIDFTEV